MRLVTTDMLEGMVKHLVTVLDNGNATRKFVEIEDLENSDFPQVMALLGGGDQSITTYPVLDEQVAVCLLIYVWASNENELAEDLLIAKYGEVLTALEQGFVVDGQQYEVDLKGEYKTDLQSHGEYGWLSKKVTVFVRHEP